MAISPPRPRHEQQNLSRLYNALIHEQDIQALETFGEFGEFGDVATQLYTARQERGTPGVLALIKSWNNRKQPAPEIKRALQCIASAPNTMPVVETQSPKQESTVEVTRDEQLFPPLPEEMRVTPDMTAGLCPLKDVYVAYSKQMSPEGYGDFHPSCFWGMLSMVAGRRIAINLRRKQYTSLIVMLGARSTLFVKTETAEVQRDVLKAAGLEWILGLTRTTPQKLLLDMAGSIPENYGDLGYDAKETLKRSLAMSGQRGWHYNEFGKLIKAMMRSSGPMSDFVEVLLQISDCPDELPSGTIARGSETVHKPYIAITGTLTPASLKTVATKNTELWSDGFFARFLFSCPPRGSWVDNPYERGQIVVPSELSKGIRDWHERLGEPLLDIIPILDDEGKDTGRVEKLWMKTLPETLYNISDAAYEAWKRYRSTLKSMISQFPTTDFDGSYGRLAMMALRVSALAASIDNASQIEYQHWLLGQEQAEMWRAGLHQVYAQVNSDDLVVGPGPTLEDRVLEYVEKLQSDGMPPSARDIAHRMHMETLKIEPVLQSLVRNGALEKVPGRQKPRYKLAGEETE